MVKRFGGDTLVLAALLLLFGFLTYHIAGQASGDLELRPQRTTHSAKPGGYKAAYLMLQQLGLPIARCDQEPSRWPDDARVMVTLTAQFGAKGMWDEAQAKAATEWVTDGHTLIIAADEDNGLLNHLKLDGDNYLVADATLAPQQPASFLNGIAGVKAPGMERWVKAPSESVSLFGDRKPLVVAFRRGSGMIYAVATPALWDNAHLGEAGNARFLAQLVASGLEAGNNRSRVYFDEYHQGFGEEQSFWTAIGSGGQWAVYQLIAVGLLAVLSAGRRFGLPRPLPPPARVSSEYVASLADLYRRARAGDAALEGVYLSFWRDLCRAAGLPIDSSAPDVAARAAVAFADRENERNVLRTRLTDVLTRCEEAIASGPKRVTDAQLLALAREIDGLRKDTGLGAE